MAVIVKCKFCSENFDRLTTPCRKEGNRWIHEGCFDYNESYESQKTELSEYACSLLGTTARKSKINLQIKQYEEEGYSLQGIKLTLKYWYEIKKQSIEKANGGIGIVKYKYNEAGAYFNDKKNIESIALKIKSGKIPKPSKTSNIVVVRKRMETKKDKLLSLDYSDEE